MKQTTLKDYHQRLLKVLVYIQKNLDQELALEELAQLACFSPFHFHRIFRGWVGESLKEYIRRLRLERAAGRLKHRDTTVIQIALEAGYESHEAFSRAFKAMFALSPSDYRIAAQRQNGAFGEPRDNQRHANLQKYIEPIEMEVKMEVKITEQQPIRVAFVRHVGPYNQCGSAWDKLCTYLGSRGLMGPETRFIGLSYDDPDVTPSEKIRYDACVPVDEDLTPDGEIGIQTISGGKYAVTTHLGPYENLSRTYAELMGQWFPRSGMEPGQAPCMEVYLNDPEGTEPEDLITDICVPIAE